MPNLGLQRLNLIAREIQSGVSIEGLRSQAVRDLILFLYENASQRELGEKQLEFKRDLHNLGTLFPQITATAEINSASVKSPIGTIGAETLAGEFLMNSHDSAKTLAASIRFDHLALNASQLPAWMVRLAPADASSGIKIGCYDFDAATTRFYDALDKIDLADPKQASTDYFKLFSSVMPEIEGVHIDFPPSFIVGVPAVATRRHFLAMFGCFEIGAFAIADRATGIAQRLHQLALHDDRERAPRCSYNSRDNHTPAWM